MSRTRSLSVKSVKGYKYFLVALLTLFVLFYLVASGIRGSFFSYISVAMYLVFALFYWYPNFTKFIKKLKAVSYDNENLYVEQGDYEIQIPFYEVKDIEIVSLDGLYKFNLYHHDQFGKEVICKPSLWYPLDYKKVDAELNRVRALVRKAHHNYKPDSTADNALPSSSQSI